jgi:hypothetical protein
MESDLCRGLSGFIGKPPGVTLVPVGQAPPFLMVINPCMASLEHFGVIGEYVGG